ncbi:thiolase C-terminal domain-containing protein [Nocardia pseudovaccinii]|uniref:thiolase C-terminal domain-containing protein n=1 Tax=Nocardia pseudovaccinii TaxID=189540 RepID=UPI003D934D51
MPDTDCVYQWSLWQMNAHDVASSLSSLCGQIGITTADVDFAELYDPFTGACMIHIEGFGLSPVGAFSGWGREGNNTLDGKTPINTHGGLLSEGHAGGLNHVVEAAQQLRPAGVADDLCTGEYDFERLRCQQVRDPEIGL